MRSPAPSRSICARNACVNKSDCVSQLRQPFPLAHAEPSLQNTSSGSFLLRGTERCFNFAAGSCCFIRDQAITLCALGRPQCRPYGGFSAEERPSDHTIKPANHLLAHSFIWREGDFVLFLSVLPSFLCLIRVMGPFQVEKKTTI